MRVLLPAPSAVRLGRSLALPFLVAACATSAPGSGSDEGPPAQAGAAGERDLAAAGGPHAGGAGRFGGGGNAGGSGKASGGRAGGAGTPSSGGNAGAGAPATCALTKPYSSKDTDCNECAEAKCCAEVNGCLDDPICDDEYVNCSLACALLPDSPEQAAIDACFADCDAQHPEGKKLYDAAIGCVEARCVGVCE